MPLIKSDQVPDNYVREPERTIAQPVKYLEPQDLGSVNLTTKNVGMKPIISNLKGYKQKVTYYNSISGAYDTTTVTSDFLPKSLQKYNKIEDMIVYLDSGLDRVQVKDFELQGKINSGITPRVNDMLTFRLLDGRLGIFTVTKVNNEIWQTHEVFSITFKLKNFSDAEPNLILDIESKVVRKLVYDKNFVGEKGSPMLEVSQYKNRQTLQNIRLRIIDDYFKWFIDNENKYLNLYATITDKVMFEREVYVDTLLTDFLMKTIAFSENHLYSQLNTIQQTYDRNFENSIWDAILNRDSSYIGNYQASISWTVEKHTNGHPLTRDLKYLGISGVVDLVDDDHIFLDEELKESLKRKPSFKDILYPLEIYNYELPRNYIFSEFFYLGDLNGMTGFEKILFRFLKRETISFSELEPYLQGYRHWSRYEQYYILPCLMLIIKAISLEFYPDM